MGIKEKENVLRENMDDLVVELDFLDGVPRKSTCTRGRGGVPPARGLWALFLSKNFRGACTY